MNHTESKKIEFRNSVDKNMTSPIIDREAKELAAEFFEKLQEAGLCSRDVLSISTQLIGIATDNIPIEKEAGANRATTH